MFGEFEYKVASASGTIKNLEWDVTTDTSSSLYFHFEWKKELKHYGWVNKSATKFHLNPMYDSFRGLRRSTIYASGKKISGNSIVVRLIPSFSFLWALLVIGLFSTVLLTESTNPIPLIVVLGIIIYQLYHLFLDIKMTEKLMDRLINTAEKRHLSERSK